MRGYPYKGVVNNLEDCDIQYRFLNTCTDMVTGAGKWAYSDVFNLRADPLTWMVRLRLPREHL